VFVRDAEDIFPVKIRLGNASRFWVVATERRKPRSPGGVHITIAVPARPGANPLITDAAPARRDRTCCWAARFGADKFDEHGRFLGCQNCVADSDRPLLADIAEFSSKLADAFFLSFFFSPLISFGRILRPYGPVQVISTTMTETALSLTRRNKAYEIAIAALLAPQSLLTFISPLFERADHNRQGSNLDPGPHARLIPSIPRSPVVTCDLTNFGSLFSPQRPSFFPLAESGLTKRAGTPLIPTAANRRFPSLARWFLLRVFFAGRQRTAWFAQ